MIVDARYALGARGRWLFSKQLLLPVLARLCSDCGRNVFDIIYGDVLTVIARFVTLFDS
jgi:hypothetical protein